MKALRDKARPHWALLLLLVIAVLLRLSGLRHGIGLHNDESSIVSNSSRLKLGDLHPPNFFYGSLLFYLVWISGVVASSVGLPMRSFEAWILLARCLSIAGGVLGILLTYRLGKEAFGNTRIAGLGATFLAFNALHIQLSRFYTSDVLLTTACIYTLLQLTLYARTGAHRAAVGSALGLGASLALKASALSLLLPMGMAFALRHLFERRVGGREVAVQLLCVLLALAVGLGLQPYVVLDFNEFKLELLDQINMVRGDVRMPWNNGYYGTPAYIYPFEQMLWYTMGVPFALAALAGTLLAAARQLKQGPQPDLIVLVWTVAAFLTIGGYQVKFLRYLLPIYPTLLLYAASFVRFLEMKAAGGRSKVSWISGVFVIWAAVGGLAFANLYRTDHIHRVASDWICRNVKPGVIILQVQWDTQLPRCGHLQNVPQYQMGPEWELPLFEMPQNKKLTVLVLGKLAQGDYLVLPTARTFWSLLKVPDEYPDMYKLVRLLVAGELGYTLVKTFKQSPSLGPFVFNDDLADESFEVHDHPKVYFFANTGHLSVQALRDVLESGHGQGSLPSLEEILAKNT